MYHPRHPIVLALFSREATENRTLLLTAYLSHDACEKEIPLKHDALQLSSSPSWPTKSWHIQRRRSQKSYQQRHEDKPEVTQAMKSKRASFYSTFVTVFKGFRVIPSLGLYHR
eukprot:scaffold6855_cov121-Skeletonema_marinoi.AAC.4